MAHLHDNPRHTSGVLLFPGDTMAREPSPAARQAGVLLTWIVVFCLAALLIVGTWAAITAIL